MKKTPMKKKKKKKYLASLGKSTKYGKIKRMPRLPQRTNLGTKERMVQLFVMSVKS